MGAIHLSQLIEHGRPALIDRYGEHLTAHQRRALDAMARCRTGALGYNYIRAPHQELGVWFRHFRRVEVLSYYADFVTNPAKWEQTRMTDTISVLYTPTSKSFMLIKRWVAAVGA